MIFSIIITIILFIALITLMTNIIVGVRTKDGKLIVLCGIGAGLTGILFGIALSSILFNI
jgi:hypothetical protein